MLKKYRNALLEIIKAADIAPHSFNPREEESGGVQTFRLQLGDSSLYFDIRTRMTSEKWEFSYKYTIVSINYPQLRFSEWPWSYAWHDFDELSGIFKKWLQSEVKKYLTYQAEVEEDKMVPDLWVDLTLSSDSSVNSNNIQNTYFSSEEHARIAESLKEFEGEVRKRAILSDEQINLLHERIEYLVQSSKRLGRKDWLAAAAGALIGFTFQAGLTSNAATQIIHLAGETLRWIAHTPMLLP